jgi:hypothetical protein
MAVAPDSFDLAFQRIEVSNGVRCVLLQRHLVEQAATLAGRHLRQEKLAAGRAMCRYTRPGMEVEAQRRQGFHAIEVEHFAAGQRSDVAALADFLDQLAQHRMTRAMHRVVEQEVLGKAPQAQAGAIEATVGIPLQHSCTFQLLQHAMQGGLGQSRLLHQTLQREELVLAGDHFQQGKQAQCRRVTVHAARFGNGFQFGFNHGFWIIGYFYLRYK